MFPSWRKVEENKNYSNAAAEMKFPSPKDRSSLENGFEVILRGIEA